jgi:hypothetical protein
MYGSMREKALLETIFDRLKNLKGKMTTTPFIKILRPICLLPTQILNPQNFRKRFHEWISQNWGYKIPESSRA